LGGPMCRSRRVSAGLIGIERGVPIELPDGADPPDLWQLDDVIGHGYPALGPAARVKA
jgi:hypothetical protein